MNRNIIELVQRWTDFAEQEPGASIADFCKNYLHAQKLNLPDQASSNERGQLIRAIGRIASAYAIYHKAAMAEIKLPAADSFYYLNGLNILGECKKMDLINYVLSETTTGMEAINKLIIAKLINERNNDQDRRSILIKLTDAGKKKLANCHSVSTRVNEIMFRNIDVEHIRTCLVTLLKVEQLHSQKSVQFRGKAFEKIYQSMLGES